jgi:hypothetical protein
MALVPEISISAKSLPRRIVNGDKTRLSEFGVTYSEQSLIKVYIAAVQL